MRRARLGIGWVGLFLSGCSEGQSFFGYEERSYDPGFNPGFEPSTPEVFGPPADQRPVTTPSKPPVPVSGGTLLVTSDGKLAVAADPDRDRVSIVSLSERRTLHTVNLSPGDEPGRVVEGRAGRVHVALRGSGEVVAIDLETGMVRSRHPACAAPRGLAYAAVAKSLHVACASGALVTLSAEDGAVTRRLELGPDLRDVVVRGDGLLVTRFKSAAMLELDGAGELKSTITLQSILRTSLKPPDVNGAGGGPTTEPLAPAVLWRPVPASDGNVQIVHQYDLDSPIDIEDPHGPSVVPQGSYGAPPGSCGGLVQAGVSRLDPSGNVAQGAPLAAPPLAVDGAVSPDGKWIALAHAGTVDPNAPSFGGAFAEDMGAVTLVGADQPMVSPGSVADCSHPILISVPGQATAVAFNPRTDAEAIEQGVWFVAQTREPALLVFVRDPLNSEPTVVELGGSSVLDTGHEIFHRDSGSGIACGSCHVEGTEDGRVWKFTPLGDRRTQAINVGLDGTAPFHWDGDMKDLDMLMTEVFVGRMGGPTESPERVAALSRWLGGLTPPTRIVAADAAEALRGKELFESNELACASCHAGPKLTNNASHSVGTTDAAHPLQVPSLVGVGYRAPFLHNGCAATLRDRFTPSCGGGDAHGKTSGLSDAQIGDLVRYLESL